jgi:hypothetical protein
MASGQTYVELAQSTDRIHVAAWLPGGWGCRPTDWANLRLGRQISSPKWTSASRSCRDRAGPMGRPRSDGSALVQVVCFAPVEDGVERRAARSWPHCLNEAAEGSAASVPQAAEPRARRSRAPASQLIPAGSNRGILPSARSRSCARVWSSSPPRNSRRAAGKARTKRSGTRGAPYG